MRSKKTKLGYCAFTLLILYFFCMDIKLYESLQKWSPPSIAEASLNNRTLKTNSGMDPFSTFNPLTVKLIMIDHMTHYVHDILGRFLVDYLHFTKIFPWISANLVSFFGLFLAIIGSKMTLSDSLGYRQIGALLFEFRNLADSLDGVVVRARKREQIDTLPKTDKMNSQVISYASGSHGTLGYNIDAICDVLGGTFLCIAILLRFLRRPPQKTLQLKDLAKPDANNNNHLKNSKYEEENYTLIKIPSSSSEHSESDEENVQFKTLWSQSGKDLHSAKEAFLQIKNQASRYFSTHEVKFIVISFGLRVLFTGAIWDYYVHNYQELLMNFSKNTSQRQLQGQAFKSTSMCLIMWLWRFLNACAMLEHLVFTTIFDKLWDYLVFTTYIGWLMLITLTIMTQLHYTELYERLNNLSFVS